jgi:hypothetical protein
VPRPLQSPDGSEQCRVLVAPYPGGQCDEVKGWYPESADARAFFAGHSPEPHLSRTTVCYARFRSLQGRRWRVAATASNSPLD